MKTALEDAKVSIQEAAEPVEAVETKPLKLKGKQPAQHPAQASEEVFKDAPKVDFSEPTTRYGKKLKIVVGKNNRMYRIHMEGGGIMPKMLEGMFTSHEFAKQAIEGYLHTMRHK